MRVTRLIALTGLFVAVCPPARADWISLQAQMADAALAGTSTFTKKNTTVLGINSTVTPKVASLSFNAYQASFGQDFTTPKDWSQYNIVQLVLRNKEPYTVTFKFILQLQADPNSYTNAFNASFWISPNTTKSFLFYLNVDDPLPYGLEYLNPALRRDTADISHGTAFRDLRTVYHWRLSYQGSIPAKLDVSDIRLYRQSLNFTGLSDRYGQYSDRFWPNKVSSDSMFATQRQNEAATLNASPGPGEQQGTTKVANPAPVPNKWAVVTLPNGKKFLQHPNGRLFWSLGLSGVSDSLSTRVQDRTHYFQSLPSSTGRFASCYSTLQTPAGMKTCFSFRKQNLMIKYGDSYMTPWLDTVNKRLGSWGFNTIGIDSHSSLLNKSTPFVAKLSTTGFGTRLTVPSQMWGSLPDPFTSGFQSWCQTSFASTLSSYKANSNFFGVFVDNELSWGKNDSNSSRYNVALGALTAPATQPAKAAFVSQLQSKYSTITALNSAWKSTFASFDALKNNRTWKPTTYTAAIIADFQVYVRSFATKYYSLVRAALTSNGLGKALYLGSRFSHHTYEVVDKAMDYVDVVSFNIYDFAYQAPWSYYNSLRKPVLISEFGITMKAWGTFGGPATTWSPSGRANAIKDLLNTAIVQPNVVGVQYYCYADQPITGRPTDYENGGFGMVDVADVPYGDSVSVFRNFAFSMYATRAGDSTGGGGGGTGGGTGGGSTGGSTTGGGGTTSIG